MPDPSIVRFRRAVASAHAELESRRQEVNDLNVFPVADGDTGDNMSMTLRAVIEELDRINGQHIDEIGRDEVVAAVARAALLGARGNSGVILSQIVRGAAEELASRPGELIDPILVSAALARAADAAYDSVRDPAEGTMLSAVRAMAHRVAQELAHMETQRLDPGVEPAAQDWLLADVLERALQAGTEAVERGPDQLPILREAGVVDAGAYGLVVIIAGVIGALRGDTPPEVEHHTAPAGGPHQHLGHESSRFRFCTNFAVTGEGLEYSSFVPQLEEIGDSVLVVGDRKTLKVHVHTDDPDSAMALFEKAGEVSRLDVADMRQQIAEREQRLAGGAAEAAATAGVVAVASGLGMAALYQGLGAHVVDGGATFNPSTSDLLAGVHAVAAHEVVLLPNSANVIMAAERAAELSEKPVRVVPTTSQQAAIPALLAFDRDRPAVDNADALEQHLAEVRTGGVAQAARDDPGGRFAAGDALGYVGEELTAWGAPEPTLGAVLASVAKGCEVVTCIAGEGAPLASEEIALLVPEGVELDYHAGGQPAWWWLIVAE
ncbi:MAG: fatty acid kinase [Thermoleophilaceae bacterium]|jgi:DAK2 domain fusion protein YloV|nr:fatty acid kinase [Thermoleophilaceae bacterium]